MNFIKDKIIKGWINNKRNHGGCLFVDIRNASGIIQATTNDENIIKLIEKIPNESIISVTGVIKKREEHQINAHLPMGNIELLIENFEVLSINEKTIIDFSHSNVAEEIKMKNRVLYLRSARMQRNLKFRAEIIIFMRNYMENLNFLEIQTPLITFSSPEGARDFIIPSRLHPGKFYALPQAPQIFKQMLMASGVERYFQIAPCFRDEDARKDRCYGEFYQLDCEMAFTTQEEVLTLVTNIVTSIIKEFKKTKCVLTRLTYENSLKLYGTDKPDLRNPLQIKDFSEIFLNTEMDLFKKAIKNGQNVRGIVASFNVTNAICKRILARVENQFKIAYILKEENEIKGPIAKFFPISEIDNNSAIFFVCDTYVASNKKLNLLREIIAEETELKLNPEEFQLVQIIDFPMFEKDGNQWYFTHNPFSKPQEIKENLEEIKAYQYDLVLNGFEICSGSIRNTNINTILEFFELTGTPKEETELRFQGLFNAFKYGVPPHGGFAVGIERLIMILLNEDNIREIVAFPLNTNGSDPFTNTPSIPSSELLKELHLK